MSKLSRSPDRNTFQKERYLERKAEEGRTPENDEDVKAMAEYYDNWNVEADQREADPEWAKNNLEYDLRSTDWITEKAKARPGYAQNIYAALCNNGFTKLAVMPILKQEEWSCSWRYAGGIVSHMVEKGDYIDWYCSGIKGGHDVDDKTTDAPLGYVPEGYITNEIREDFKRLGWFPAPGGDWENFIDPV